ncbi:Methyl-accepting chemotaxis protein II [Pararobbsia alpina]|uniref:methyl-accepting chemotaxis protein n=1 Tax=Pararobbsia alpina TaxID=621374 RepID=UPI0039A6B811
MTRYSGMDRAARGAGSVKQSLRGAFAVLLFGTLVVGGLSLVQLHRLNGATQTVYTEGYETTKAAEEARGAMLRATRAQKSLLTATTAKERDDLGHEIETNIARMGTELGVIDDFTRDAAALDLLKALHAATTTWSQHERDFVTLMKAQPLDLSQMHWQVGIADVSLLVETEKLEKKIDALVAQRDASARHTIDSAAATFRTSFVLIGVITVALFAIAIAIGGWVIRRITSQLGGEPSYAKAIAERIAGGDLSGEVALARRDDSSMLHALADMQDGLARTVAEIAQSASAVAAASSEISAGNADLSQRTEMQASSLERTASSMDQLTSTVKVNADNAKQAAELAHTASEVARQGGDVVGRVVGTMQEIDASSKSIHDIIGVIEGIAFQTNILALNAAVEAARAGEHGRGFAVVATEVRNLAQRSATAAKEIQALISTSVERAGNGAALAQEAGRTMGEVVNSVERVAHIIAEISAASAEQSTGIHAIGDAVSQMDETTQQNAALVEQASAAALALDEQAQMLQGLVSRFHLAA